MDENYITTLETANEELRNTLYNNYLTIDNLRNKITDLEKAPTIDIIHFVKHTIDKKIASFDSSTKINFDDVFFSIDFGRGAGHTSTAINLYENSDCILVCDNLKIKDYVTQKTSSKKGIITYDNFLKSILALRPNQIVIFDGCHQFNKEEVKRKISIYPKPYIVLRLQ